MGSSIKASNCYVYDVSVTGYTNVGGMIGNAIDNLSLENCFTKPVQIVTSKVKSGVAWSAPYSSFNVLNTYWLSGSASYAFTTNTNAGATALSMRRCSSSRAMRASILTRSGGGTSP